MKQYIIAGALALIVAGCEGSTTFMGDLADATQGSDVLAVPGEPVSQFTLINRSDRTIADVRIRRCRDGRLFTDGVFGGSRNENAIPPGEQFTIEVSRGCYDIASRLAYSGEMRWGRFRIEDYNFEEGAALEVR